MLTLTEHDAQFDSEWLELYDKLEAEYKDQFSDRLNEIRRQNLTTDREYSLALAAMLQTLFDLHIKWVPDDLELDEDDMFDGIVVSIAEDAMAAFAQLYGVDVKSVVRDVMQMVDNDDQEDDIFRTRAYRHHNRLQ